MSAIFSVGCFCNGICLLFPTPTRSDSVPNIDTVKSWLVFILELSYFDGCL